MYNILYFLFKKRIWIISYFDVIMFFVAGALAYVIDSFLFFLILMIAQSIVSNTLMWFFKWHPEPSQKEIERELYKSYSNKNNHWH